YESGPREIEVSIRRRDHPEEVFAGSKIRLAGDDWKRYEFRLDLEAGKITPLEPADFVIAFGNKGRVLVDQASLMPADNVDGMGEVRQRTLGRTHGRSSVGTRERVVGDIPGRVSDEAACG